MRVPWRLRVMLAQERAADLSRRPVCWARGHVPLTKMDLRSGKLCARCHAFLPNKPR
jgi:hypothetical protein